MIYIKHLLHTICPCKCWVLMSRQSLQWMASLCQPGGWFNVNNYSEQLSQSSASFRKSKPVVFHFSSNMRFCFLSSALAKNKQEETVNQQSKEGWRIIPPSKWQKHCGKAGKLLSSCSWAALLGLCRLIALKSLEAYNFYISHWSCCYTNQGLAWESAAESLLPPPLEGRTK